MKVTAVFVVLTTFLLGITLHWRETSQSRVARATTSTTVHLRDSTTTTTDSDSNRHHRALRWQRSRDPGQTTSSSNGNSRTSGNNDDDEEGDEMLLPLHHRDLMFHSEEQEMVHIIVKFRDDAGKELLKSNMPASVTHVFDRKFGSFAAMKVTRHTLAELLRSIEEDDGPLSSAVEKVEYDTESYLVLPIELTGTINHDKVEQDQHKSEKVDGHPRRYLDHQDDHRRHLSDWVTWGLTAIQADQVLPTPNPDAIKVCVVDTGYDNGHVDLPLLDTTADGFSSISHQQDWFVDFHGHGTHVTGTIAALENEQGILGVFPNVSLFIAKGLKDNGERVSTSNLMEAVESCIDNGARIVSMSLKSTVYVSVYANAFQQAYQDPDNSVLFIAGAGNDGDSSHSYPASYSSVMSVAAIDSEIRWANFSQYNDQVEISAPGVGMWSTVPDTVPHNGNGYAKYSGTSMATPHVAGVAALVWSHDPTCTAQQIRRILLASAQRLQDESGSDCNHRYGRGLVQAKAAVDMLKQGGCEAADHLPLLDAEGLTSQGTCFDKYPAH